MGEEVKSGKETTEYKEAQSAKLWGVISMVLGFITVTGAQVIQAMNLTEDSTAGIIAGAIIAAAGLAYRTLVSLGYIKSRADVKQAASIGKAAAIQPPEVL